MLEISKQQIIEAGSQYGERAARSGVAFNRTTRRLPYPTYAEALKELRLERPQPSVTLNNLALIEHRQVLSRLGGLRVVAGVKTLQGEAYLPGVILPDGRGRVGLLTSRHDVRGTTAQDATKLFTPLQQLLLAKIAAEHQPETGQHAANGTVNGAEIGHAAVVAATLSPVNIHAKVHQLTAAGNLSARVAATGATDIQTKHGRRQNSEAVQPFEHLAGLIIVDGNQVPWPLDLDMFDLSAGFTHAAVQTQIDRPKPDLSANLANLKGAV